MLKLISLIFFVFFLQTNAFARDYFKFKYTVIEGDTFSSILKTFVKEQSVINSRTPLIAKNIKNNPQVSDWKNLKPGTKIDLYISRDFMDLEHYKLYYKDEVKKNELAAAETAKKQAAEKAVALQNAKYLAANNPVGLKGTIYYMASLGVFTQNDATVANIKFNQNSPATLGGSFNYYPIGKYYSYAFSGYFSYISPATNSLDSTQTSIPPELGATFYGDYRLSKYNFSSYGGLDFEKFSTFNMTSINNDQKLYVDSVSVVYLTAGVSQLFYILNKQIFTKLSFSKSLLTTYKSGAPTTSTLSEKYSGYKAMLYFNHKLLNSKFSIHTMVKYHKFTGVSNLSITRFGIGIGYPLF